MRGRGNFIFVFTCLLILVVGLSSSNVTEDTGRYQLKVYIKVESSKLSWNLEVAYKYKQSRLQTTAVFPWRILSLKS